MSTDFWLVVQWWGALFLIGAAAFPLTKRLFGPSGRATRSDSEKGGRATRSHSEKGGRATRSDSGVWWDHGYLFAKAVGMFVITYIVWIAGSVRLFPFTMQTILVVLGVVFVTGLLVQKRPVKKTPRLWLRVGIGELLTISALLFWSWIKAHQPDIQGLEKFMDFGFSQSILGSQYFPPSDMWFAGETINYYYFGHVVMSLLTKLSTLDLRYTFNLMLATLFSLTFTMSFSIGYQLMVIARATYRKNLSRIRHWLLPMTGGIVTAYLVTLAGNMQTIYAFTQGYTGDDVQPFWELLWPIGALPMSLSEGMAKYWYANATRFIPFTIHEFPSYSFVVSDVHGHVLSLPFVLLAVALLVRMFVSRPGLGMAKGPALHRQWFELSVYGVLLSVLLMTNALDGPIYAALFLALLVTRKFKVQSSKFKDIWKEILVPVLLVGGVVLIASLPFLLQFDSFVDGIAINCPPSFLAASQFGPILFENVDKCQRSPLWMLIVLWGFFIYAGVGLLLQSVKRHVSRVTLKSVRSISWSIKRGSVEWLLLVFFFFSVILIIVPEFVYFKDIYPAHFRSNTMFKLGYQAFILFSIVSGYVIVRALLLPLGTRRWTRIVFLVLLVPQLFLVSIYPIFSVRSYFGGLRQYQGLDGIAWLERRYPSDYHAIEWLRQETRNKRQETSCTNEKYAVSRVSCPMSPVLVEVDGDSYTDYARFSTFTGIPTIIGWPVHEWLWRGTYDVVSPRRADVRAIYEAEDKEVLRELLNTYQVQYLVVGQLERETFTSIPFDLFDSMGTRVYDRLGTTIWEISREPVGT